MKSSMRKITRNAIYIALLFLLVYLVIAIKLYTFSGITSIYLYTVLVTTFMLSRILGSFFYKSYLKKNQHKQVFEPKVSFVIPCKDEESAIYHTIKKCFESDYPENKIEVIVVNDGSTDNTLNEMLRFKKENPKCNLIIINFKKNKGKRKAMAIAIRKSRGEIFIQLDSDSYPLKKSMRKLIAPFTDKAVGATVGHTLPSNSNKNILTKMQNAYYFMSFRALKATESVFDMVFCCSGCFSAYRKSCIIDILDQWLDEKFLGREITFGDDRALTNWVIRKGYKTVYVAEAIAYTVVPEKIRQFLKQQVRWKKGWFINSYRILPEIIKRDKFIAFTYLIPLMLITLLTPFIALKALIINPIFLGISPVFYIFGIMIVSYILYVHYNMYSRQKYGKYMLIWSVLNMTLLSYIMLYALYDLRNMRWGTR